MCQFMRGNRLIGPKVLHKSPFSVNRLLEVAGKANTRRTQSLWS